MPFFHKKVNGFMNILWSKLLFQTGYNFLSACTSIIFRYLTDRQQYTLLNRAKARIVHIICEMVKMF
ncbi:uncharacterized protein Gasu_25420 [Galdieria sulphuraria]|uniref:Uncharacterized protein n=1 Tax=Galdieria sulphuraria TaxID=130081 RepID=M2XJ79_GALSU|nr:uncharacterized protein Gasu_25420 [Galdieria sulphuraria]EME30167.1 hypothetical protein Gasu_25420 [Galdieria sulphuraria]|eukprot:XP_005706687.1 hypothetical protein Gasu_25420 [Galdieria sulphuraria]